MVARTVTQRAVSAARQRVAAVLIEFDQTTMANMTAALDAVCKRIPPEKDSHEVRKRIADAMVACAKSRRHTLVDFQNVGYPAGAHTAAEVSLVRLETAVWF
jgi:hypothetical protein